MSESINVFANPGCPLERVVEYVERVTSHQLDRSIDDSGKTLYLKDVMDISIISYSDHDFEDDCGIAFSRYPIFVGFTRYAGPDPELRIQLCRVLARRVASVVSSELNCECIVVDGFQLLLDTYPRGSFNAAGGPSGSSIDWLEASRAGRAPIPFSSADALAIDEILVAEGKAVEPNLLAREWVDGRAGKQADRFVDGVLTEYKASVNLTVDAVRNTAGRMAARITKNRSQAPHFILDVRQVSGITQEMADEALRRAFIADEFYGAKLQFARIIGPNGVDAIRRRQ